MSKNRSRIVSLPAFPNAFPYNELLLDGKLIAKTRSWAWNHRGLTLLYTSSRVDRPVASAYGMQPTSLQRKAIVGIGKLVDVRDLHEKELERLLCQFNNVDRSRIDELLDSGRRYVGPLPIGYFFEELRRFEHPVPFAWPAGPVKSIGVPVSLVAHELRRLDIRV